MTKFFGTFFRVNFDQFCYIKKSSYLCIAIKNNSIHMTDKQKHKQYIVANTDLEKRRDTEQNTRYEQREDNANDSYYGYWDF